MTSELHVVTVRGLAGSRAPADFPPSWASAWGDDRYGLWADLQVVGVVQRLRWLEPGDFVMGDEQDPGSQTLRHCDGFWLADSACTQALWLTVLGGPNPSHFQQGAESAQRPVEGVSWDDVQRFLAALQAYAPEAAPALPEEREWEYACRAGTTGPFSFGDDISPVEVNYDGNYPHRVGSKGLYRQSTVPVRSLPANPWGLFEMHGNVWEWCQDVFEPEKTGGPREQVVPRRALRGGSWSDRARRARCAIRFAVGPAVRYAFVGFRFALRSTSPGQVFALAEPGLKGAGRPGAR